MISIFSNWKNPVKIENLEIDTVLREEHRYSNNITDYPVEVGSNVTDHIRQNPEVLFIEGITSNTPVRFISENFRALVRDNGSNRFQLAFNTLLRYAGYVPPKQAGVEPEKVYEPEILTIVTGLKVYTNMAISNLTFPRDSGTGESVGYSVEFKKIRLVEAEFTSVQKTSSLGGKAANIENQGSKNIDAGKNSTKEAPQSSILYKAAKTVKGWFN